MKPHSFHPEADEEYAKAAAYDANISLELGGRFYDEMERVIAEVCQAPVYFAELMPMSGGTWRTCFPSL